MGINEYPELIIPCGIGDSFKVFDNSVRILNDKRLYEIYSSEKNLLFLLNSTLFALFQESEARVGLGDGLLDLTVYEVEETKIVNPKFLTKQLIKELQSVFSKILKRKIYPIFKEVEQKDRMKLDSLLLNSIGLNPEEWLPKIYSGLCEMVKERLDLPKMRKKQKKDKESFSYDEVKRSVVKDVLGGDKKLFPQRFYFGKKEYENLHFEQYYCTSRKLTMESFFNYHTVKDEDGRIVFETNSEAKAKFGCIIAQNTKGYNFRIPSEEKICEQIINSYSLYVSEQMKTLEANAQTKLHDWALAEKMAKEILTEKGLLYDFK